MRSCPAVSKKTSQRSRKCSSSLSFPDSGTEAEHLPTLFSQPIRLFSPLLCLSGRGQRPGSGDPQHLQRAPGLPHLLAHLRHHGRPDVCGQVLQGESSSFSRMYILKLDRSNSYITAGPGISPFLTVMLVPLYRGPGIYGVKGSVPILFLKLHHRGERGRKGRECKYQSQTPGTFDIRNNSTPAPVVCKL